MKVQQIMTQNPVCISDAASIYDAHALMHNRGVRHLPVISETSATLVGVLTHKKMITTVIGLYNRYGPGALERRERHMPLSELIETEYPVLFADTSLLEVVDYFIEHKYGCLPVTDADGKVIGIVTSSDFVSLCKTLLQKA
ncbi:CBS domain-containing protein [Shewanella avicenniae]|uniref:CBS domain-containing protein n=1 Tax=Shewanella avicenniae TaxID=2814294 RepID=A0ABX7QUP7_9GAMM|nr:CBS domain-containing protein [Shewanella avicenniae]QSX34371.1 CBS domain-containing protein [Shewanella avicenniae]